MFVPRDTIAQGPWRFGHTPRARLAGIAATARLRDDGTPPGTVQDGLKHFLPLVLPGGIIGFRHCGNVPGPQRAMVPRYGRTEGGGTTRTAPSSALLDAPCRGQRLAAGVRHRVSLDTLAVHDGHRAIRRVVLKSRHPVQLLRLEAHH